MVFCDGFLCIDVGVVMFLGVFDCDVLLWFVVFDVGLLWVDGEVVEFVDVVVVVMSCCYVDRPAARVAGAQAARDLGRGRVALVARAGQRVLVGDRVPLDRAAAVIRALTAAR